MADASHDPALRADSVAAVVLGNALEFYDFTIYAFFAEPIGKAFLPGEEPARQPARLARPVRARLRHAADRPG